MAGKAFSIIIPARNEARWLGLAVSSALRAIAYYHGLSEPCPELNDTEVEVLIVDNLSTDQTSEMLRPYMERYGVRRLTCSRIGAPSARNRGAEAAAGRVLVFLDADTRMPSHALVRIGWWCAGGKRWAGMTSLASLEGGLRASLWFAFWNQVRRLPIAHAKAMPALMFCTREAFQRFGPFDETVAIGEEWPILAGCYHADPSRLAYDRGLIARSSSRRMDQQPFGYVATLFKYVWAVIHKSGRRKYSDRYR